MGVLLVLLGITFLLAFEWPPKKMIFSVLQGLLNRLRLLTAGSLSPGLLGQLSRFKSKMADVVHTRSHSAIMFLNLSHPVKNRNSGNCLDKSKDKLKV